MPALDFFSMTSVLAINLLAVALALPWSLGQQLSPPARHAQRFFLLQGLAWTLVLASTRLRATPWFDPLALLAITCTASAMWQMSRALRGWLGPRHRLLERGIAALCIAGPAGSLMLTGMPPYRLAWFSACHGLCVGLLACMALYPARRAARSWRYLSFGIGMVMAVVLVARSYLALYTPWLSGFAAESLPNQGFALLAPLCSTLLLVAVLAAWRDETNQLLSDMALQDTLTGLPNRRALEQQGQAMLQRARREGLPLSLVLLDLDHFKLVNDRHGHAMGDQALCLMARTLQTQMRGQEFAARWGGEEFCLLLHATPESTRALCTRLRAALRQEARQELNLELDFSAGHVFAPSAWSGLTVEHMMRCADAALYQAKHQGRGRCESAIMEPALLK